MRYLFILLLAFSCKPTPVLGKPNQDTAIAAIWSTFGRTDAPPAVEWIEGGNLNCPARLAPAYGGWLISTHYDYLSQTTTKDLVSTCVAGLTTSSAYSQVAWTNTSFSRTALAHEFGHVLLMRLGLDPDINHQSAVFQAGGVVQQAEAKLRELGL